MNITSRTFLCTLTAALAFGVVSSASAEPPRWAAAISQLESAKAEMTKAKSRGGKKDEAIKKIDEAIALLKGDVEEIKEKKKK